MTKMKHDDGLEWLRDIRRKMAANFGHDPKKAAAYYQELQRHYTPRLYHREAQVGTDVPADSVLQDRATTKIATDQCAPLTTYGPPRKRTAKRAK